MSKPYTVLNTLNTQESLSNFFNTSNNKVSFSKLYDKFINLDETDRIATLARKFNYDNEPQELNFTIYSNGESFNFSVFIDIDKLYTRFENSNFTPYEIEIDNLDIALALRSNGVTRDIERPILVISDEIISNIFTLDEYKGRYYPIDGRNRLKIHIEQGYNTINCYPVSLNLLLDCMISKYDALALELLLYKYTN